jgi:hypothetical protein
VVRDLLLHHLEAVERARFDRREPRQGDGRATGHQLLAKRCELLAGPAGLWAFMAPSSYSLREQGTPPDRVGYSTNARYLFETKELPRI